MTPFLFSLLVSSPVVHATNAHVQALQCQAAMAAARTRGQTKAPLNISGDAAFDDLVDKAMSLLPRAEERTKILEVAYELSEILKSEYPADKKADLLAFATHRMTSFVRMAAAAQRHRASLARHEATRQILDQVRPSVAPDRPAPAEPTDLLSAHMVREVRRLIAEIEDDLG